MLPHYETNPIDLSKFLIYLSTFDVCLLTSRISLFALQINFSIFWDAYLYAEFFICLFIYISNLLIWKLSRLQKYLTDYQ